MDNLCFCVITHPYSYFHGGLNKPQSKLINYILLLYVNVIIYLCPYPDISYRKVSNIRRTLEGNKIVDHSYVVGASPVGAAPTTSSFST